ncbi:uncharacterized protein AMSG_00612 [Thecamonas trahens ATCC 50062]|uniref:Uncharacterized protein n=1 Tax=Thecamonas trahens ATCC 50062 TaxID=461836 RepID=A0A0L0DDM8_THETB|nr:hypothetical protein AMSG_00612 [Thecamonas trahens ATCC 50062]KNC50452.1 hypothetical protein AMSG_00612 [Thecamonas trahens ATCC 50062]|eukprot:XP_013762348.1 hypothetical protein AMSG_00612 [Thecamonas trahens ATCC 50062]
MSLVIPLIPKFFYLTADLQFTASLNAYLDLCESKWPSIRSAAIARLPGFISHSSASSLSLLPEGRELPSVMVSILLQLMLSELPAEIAAVDAALADLVTVAPVQATTAIATAMALDAATPLPAPHVERATAAVAAGLAAVTRETVVSLLAPRPDPWSAALHVVDPLLAELDPSGSGPLLSVESVGAVLDAVAAGLPAAFEPRHRVRALLAQALGQATAQPAAQSANVRSLLLAALEATSGPRPRLSTVGAVATCLTAALAADPASAGDWLGLAQQAADAAAACPPPPPSAAAACLGKLRTALDAAAAPASGDVEWRVVETLVYAYAHVAQAGGPRSDEAAAWEAATLAPLETNAAAYTVSVKAKLERLSAALVAEPVSRVARAQLQQTSSLLVDALAVLDRVACILARILAPSRPEEQYLTVGANVAPSWAPPVPPAPPPASAKRLRDEAAPSAGPLPRLTADSPRLKRPKPLGNGKPAAKPKTRLPVKSRLSVKARLG